eukprot:2115921-Prymnesium_polylepis.1
MMRLFRVLRPLRSLSVIPMLREVANSFLVGLFDLKDTFMLILFFMLMFSIFLVALLASALRYRCRDDVYGTWLDDHGAVCSMGGAGVQCPINASCVDSGVGPYADLQGLEPYYVQKDGREDHNPLFANPVYVMPFDNIMWAFLGLFQIWVGVGWTFIAYRISDSGGFFWQMTMTLIYVVGAWFMINLLVAVLGSAFEREHAKQEKEREEKEERVRQKTGVVRKSAKSGM